MTVCQYLPLCWIRLPPKVNVEEGIYALHFYGCKKVYKSWLLLLEALPNLIDTLLHSCQLEGYCYDCLWHGEKGTWYKKTSSAYHHWPELWHYICLFSQKLLQWKERNMQTHTYTHHTTPHTHTHTHTHNYPSAIPFVHDWYETV